MQKLDPKAVWLFFVNSIMSWLILAFILSYWLGSMIRIITSESSQFTLIGTPWLIFLGILIVAFIWAKLSYHFYRYELGELGFKKEYGVIYKKYVTIPYDRIQNVDIYRGILARILGLSDLNIQTAGSSAGMVTGEGRLPGISKEIAEQLRDELIRRAKNSRSQGL